MLSQHGAWIASICLGLAGSAALTYHGYQAGHRAGVQAARIECQSAMAALPAPRADRDFFRSAPQPERGNQRF